MKKIKKFTPFAASAKKQQQNLPIFPLSAFPRVLREFTQAVAESLQVTVDMVAVQLLAVLAVALQGKFVVKPKAGWFEPLNLYTLVVAKPSERKSPALKATTQVLKKFEKEENQKREPKIRQDQIRKSLLKRELNRLEKELEKDYEESLLSEYAEKKVIYEHFRVEQNIRMQVDDVTPEAMADVLAMNEGKAAIISSEGGIFDTMAGRYTGVANIDVFTKSYSNDAISIERKGQERITIERPSLTMLLTVQPEVISSIMGNQVFRGRGLLARFLYSMPASPVGERLYETPPVNDEICKAYERLILGLLRIPTPEEPWIIEFSPEAHQQSKAFFEEIETVLQTREEWIDDWIGKLHGQTCRIAGLLHAAQWVDDADQKLLSGETMAAAIKIGRYFLEHARSTFTLMDALDPEEIRDAKYILKRLQSTKYGQTEEFSKKELFDICRSHFKKVDQMLPALQCLEEHGYLRIEKIETKGRPTERILLSPAYIQRLKDEKNSLPLDRNSTDSNEQIEAIPVISTGQHPTQKSVVSIARENKPEEMTDPNESDFIDEGELSQEKNPTQTQETESLKITTFRNGQVLQTRKIADRRIHAVKAGQLQCETWGEWGIKKNTKKLICIKWNSANGGKASSPKNGKLLTMASDGIDKTVKINARYAGIYEDPEYVWQEYMRARLQRRFSESSMSKIQGGQKHVTK